MNEQNNEHKLKSAEEWYLESDMLRGLKWRPETVMDTIKQIQLNAYKAGMTEAAAMIGYEDYRHCSNVDCREAILSARDKKGEL